MRKRFSDALRWYSQLDNDTEHGVQSAMDRARALAQSFTSAADTTRTSTIEPSTTSSSNLARSSADIECPPTNAETTEASDYLRHRCPACFGSAFARARTSYVLTIICIASAHPRVHDRSCTPDIIVCIDGNFTQKRRHDKTMHYDPPRQHPDSSFLSKAVVDAMATHVETLRASPPSSRSQRGDPARDDDDFVEVGLQVPVSVLNSCNNSFVAADEKRQKASTQYFDDTGLMALLCRHDRVLWLVNMKSAGEKQHYALALVAELFKNLPIYVTVGLLYDIACQLHRSCIKWDFLSDVRDRLSFAISVFHAYGHQWPCQVVYHPRKCVGFGLSDGEGCERFWSMIKRLIAPLRVSGVSVAISS